MTQKKITCDFQKAFDKIATEAILGTMKAYKFSNYLVEWTDILYSNFTARVQNNGYLSNAFPVEQSVHQGAPNSCYYFVLVAEILADAIRNNKDIQGIKVGAISYLLSQFADDMDSATKEECVDSFFNTLKWFQSISGLTINYDKTTVYRINSLNDTDAARYTSKQIKWSSGPMNILGIDVCTNNAEAIELNYNKLLLKVTTILKAWENRGLSLEGKVLIINTLIGSLFVYKMMVLPAIPTNYVKKIEKIMEQFIWGKRARPKISTKTLQRERKNGGLKLVDLETKDRALKISWIQTIQEEEEIANLVYHSLNSNLKETIWLTNLHVSDVDMVIDESANTFWKDVLKAWSHINALDKIALWQPIWWNSLIRIGNKPVLYTTPFARGLVEIGQFYNGISFISADEADQRFSLDILKYNGLRTAIKSAIKNYGFTENDPLYYEICKDKNIVKKAYSELLKKNYIEDEAIRKWCCDLSIELSEDLAEKVFINVLKLTVIGKLRSFQYRLLRRAVITNVHLAKWGIISSNMCSFCDIHVESVLHLMVECDHVKVLWKKIADLCMDMFGMTISTTADKIIFNEICSNSKYRICNMICLITKQYVYRQRCQKKCLDFLELKRYIFNFRNCEKYYAIKDEKMRQFCSKWDPSNMKEAIHCNSINDILYN